MARFSLARNKHVALLWNANDHFVQVARIARVDEKPLLIDAIAELPNDDHALADWLQQQFPERSGYLPAYGGFHPAERVLVRENINTRHLDEAGYLRTLLANHSKSAAMQEWHAAAFHPTDGDLFTAATPSRAGLLLGVPFAAVRDVQQRLRKLGVRPRRLEVGSVALLGALTRHLRESALPHAVVACEIGQTQTRIYFLAKDGVHTPATLPHGLLSIEEAAMKELNAPDIATARAQLAAPTEELKAHSRRLVRMLTRHLKPAVDYFEMQTGQPIGALYCAHLPEKLGWLEGALSAAIDLQFLVPDFVAGLPALGLELAPDLPAPSRSWFQAFSLIGDFTPPVVHEAKS